METTNDVTELQRVEIEARVLVPVLESLCKEFDKEKVMSIVKEALDNQSRGIGKGLATAFGGNGIEQLEQMARLFGQNGAQETELIELTDTICRMDVTKCAYTEMYRRLGYEKWGPLICCGRDAALYEGFNPELTFIRKSTIMEGAKVCDFCLKFDERKKEAQ